MFCNYKAVDIHSQPFFTILLALKVKLLFQKQVDILIRTYLRKNLALQILYLV